MFLVIDVGNSHTVTGIYDDDKLVGHWRMKSDSRYTADELAIRYHALFAIEKIQKEDLHGIIIASVVPNLQAAWLACCRNYFSEFLKHDIIVVEVDKIRDLVQVDVENANQVGADRLVNSIAAWHRNPVKQVVIDFGTAITFDCVDTDCTYIGGVILPGVAISLEALTSRTARLPQVDISTPPKKVIGRNTAQAMTSGILHGYGSLVDGMVKRIRREMQAEQEEFAVIATGGMAPLIAPYTTSIDQIEPMLTLQGLSLIFQQLIK